MSHKKKKGNLGNDKARAVDRTRGLAQMVHGRQVPLLTQSANHTIDLLDTYCDKCGGEETLTH